MNTQFLMPSQPDMSAEDYHALDYLSNSMMSKLKKSPLHLRQYLRSEHTPTPAMLRGTAVHSAVLEPGLFDQEYARLPELNYSTKAGKEAKAELAEKYSPDRMLKADVYDDITAMRDSVLSHPIASDIIENSRTEVSRFWVDGKTSVTCKARIDIMPNIDTKWDDCIVDLKTTRDCMDMSRIMANLGYARGAAHYLSSFDLRNRFILICVESQSPFGTICYEISPSAIEYGKREQQRLVAEYATLSKNMDEWPGYPDGIVELDLPAWTYSQELEVNE